ncbi:MAG: hypothetical protein CMM84_19015 [Rhodothermaceae bacterium]|uniref:LPS assembly lipoprotein LptE n=1 Tax=Rubrivirga sp. SAORIC476 TaxID=1961794 RepID=UPI000BA947C5|nr:LPS assembly lipoprotein LptE [Rubrivirga sp. SAORIC476]MAQ95604.1 hypothetical protein [Rhodothermaceae bacterium]MBC12386.1 hypothetical protein [Rhodothermaceae bacterium]
MRHPASGIQGGARRARRAVALCAALLAASCSPMLLQGCGVYSFSGATIPAQLQTVAVPLAEDRSTGGPPGLDRLMTDALIDRFVDRSRLALEPDEGEADAVVRATIERYSIAPVAVTDQNVAALNRVTLSVRVVVEDRVESAELLSRSFSATEDFAPADGLQGEADASATALDQIARDAFTAATSDW